MVQPAPHPAPPGRSPQDRRLNLVAVGLFGLMLLATALMWSRLPERMPIHWDLRGRVDGTGSRWTAVRTLPLLSLCSWGLVFLVRRLEPNRSTLSDTVDRVLIALLSLFAASHLTLLLSGPVPLTFAVGLSALSAWAAVTIWRGAHPGPK